MTDIDAVEDGPTPELEDVLRAVFGMSRSELELCILLMEGGPMTAAELADRIGLDRSLVNRHLNHLEAICVVERGTRLVRTGGCVNVYEHAAIEDIEDSFEQMLSHWMAAALYHIREGMVKEKEAAVASAREMQDTIGDGGHDSIYLE